jgi:DeoR family ulaG and ulaABCDEF operon transcriptional repressor
LLEKQRQQLILDILEAERFASVRLLSSELNASEATIRRDLTKMSESKQLKKIRGGAEVLDGVESASANRRLAGSAFVVDVERHAENKRLIAQKAAELCEEGESIIINGGSSTFMMGQFLAKRNLNVLTNSFVLANFLTENSSNQITVPGGEIYRKQGIILSAFENDTIQNYHGTKMFMGTPGISEHGVTESDPLLIRAEQKLRRQADQLIVLADSSKVGKRSNLIFAPLSDVDILITDSKADQSVLSGFESRGVKVIQVAAAADDDA